LSGTDDAGRPGTVLYAVGQAVFDATGRPIAAARSNEEARRIAASLNLALGLSTDDLEEWSIGSVQSPHDDSGVDLHAILAASESEPRDGRGPDRRKGDRRRAIREVPAHEVS